MEEKKDIYILAIESSCDETAGGSGEKRQRGAFQCDFLSD